MSNLAQLDIFALYKGQHHWWRQGRLERQPSGLANKLLSCLHIVAGAWAAN